MTTSRKSPDPIDIHIGARIRMRRLEMGLSQEKLGEALGLTFQQVQKYEKGINRVGGSRMAQIAGILRVDVGFFYQGTPGTGDHPTASAMDDFMTSKDGLIIAHAFVRIADPDVRRTIALSIAGLSRGFGATQRNAHGSGVIVMRHHCLTCLAETEHRHLHDCAHGLAETHMHGTERFVCTACDRATFAHSPDADTFRFILDGPVAEARVMTEVLTCDHDFECQVGIGKFSDKPGQGTVELRGACRLCGTPLVFYGPRGANAPFPVASVDRTELRAPVTFGYAPKFQPGPTVLINGPEIVPVGGRFDG